MQDEFRCPHQAVQQAWTSCRTRSRMPMLSKSLKTPRTARHFWPYSPGMPGSKTISRTWEASTGGKLLKRFTFGSTSSKTKHPCVPLSASCSRRSRGSVMRRLPLAVLERQGNSKLVTRYFVLRYERRNFQDKISSLSFAYSVRLTLIIASLWYSCKTTDRRIFLASYAVECDVSSNLRFTFTVHDKTVTKSS